MDVAIGAIRNAVGMSSSQFSVHRDRLIKAGWLIAPAHGHLSFADIDASRWIPEHAQSLPQPSRR